MKPGFRLLQVRESICFADLAWQPLENCPKLQHEFCPNILLPPPLRHVLPSALDLAG